MPRDFKYLTQKNSFIEKQDTMTNTPVKSTYEPKLRASIQTSVSLHQSLTQPLSKAKPHYRHSSVTDEKPEIVEVEPTKSKGKALKCTQKVHFKMNQA